MKRKAILHGELSRIVALMGHGDLLVIGDAGLPVPAGVPLIDLAVSPGIPGVFDLLDAVLAELVVERAAIATEAAPALASRFRDRLDCEAISHAALKSESARACAVIRTGEFTPYANIALWAGVPF